MVGVVVSAQRSSAGFRRGVHKAGIAAEVAGTESFTESSREGLSWWAARHGNGGRRSRCEACGCKLAPDLRRYCNGAGRV